MPTFMYGPKDGAEVPELFWVLDVIEMVQKSPDGTRMIYFYRLNEKDKNYYYGGQFEDNDLGGENE